LKIHLDTDMGGDIDDACALAMLLRWSGVEMTAITTSAEAHGRRAGYVRHILRLAHRDDIPVAAGAEAPLPQQYPDDDIYWGTRMLPSPNALETALLLLKHSIEHGATVVGIGPLTNLSLLEQHYPGILGRARLVLMGGYIYPPRAGFPPWGIHDDYNMQVDVPAATYVLAHATPTLVPVTVTGETFFRRAFLPRLTQAGALGALLARQAEAFAKDQKMEEKFGETCSKLPRDIINFQHDPLACAIALGWHEGVEIGEVPLKIEVRDGLLHEIIDPNGKRTRVVTKIDGHRFSQFWIDTVADVART
jgi:purine nucleosidase